MSNTVPIPAFASTRGGLEVWMERVVERADRARDGWDADSVHDLRVALRRCRAMAEALSQVNPDSGWWKIRKSSRDLFRVLGALRDTQVERSWVKKLALPQDPLRAHLLRTLSKRERDEREAARKTLEDFSLKDWKKLSRRLERKARLFPLESIVFQRLALSNLLAAADLFTLARRRHSGVAWHQARIGLKYFRYVTENFLPQRYARWNSDVKRIQDLLGDVHDLDLLRTDVLRNSSAADPAVIESWREKIQVERKPRLAEAIAKTSGSGSLLHVWQAAFEIAHSLTVVATLDRRTA